MTAIDALSSYLSNFTFNIPDQAYCIEAINLRPLTQHYFILDDLDFSNRCVAQGHNAGNPLITDTSGRINLIFYWSSQNAGALGLDSTLAALFSSPTIGNKTWVLSNIDGTSQCQGTLIASFSDPTALEASLTITSNNSGNSIPSLLTSGTPPQCQTFYVDPNACSQAPNIYISSITIYNKYRPNATNNKSGINNPGMSLYIVPTLNGVPNFGLVTHYPMARREYVEIVPSLDGSQSTIFKFDLPVLLVTGQTYGFIIIADGNDPGYIWWEAVVGQYNVLTNQKTTTLGNQFTGNFYDLTTDVVNWQPVSGTALKFDLNCCRFAVDGVAVNSATQNYFLHIGNYEFCEYDVVGSIGHPWGGELVYMPGAGPSGNCAIVAGNNIVVAGGGLNFSTWYSLNTEPNYIVITDNQTTNIRRVLSSNGSSAIVSSAFSFTNSAVHFYAAAPVAQVYLADASVDLRGVKNRLMLANSTANSTIFFSNTGTLVGETSGCTLANCIFENIIVTDVDPQVYVTLPSGASYTVEDTTSYTTTTNGISATQLSQTAPVQLFTDNIFPAGAAKCLMSRSNEVRLYSPAHASDPANSSIIEVDVTSSCDFTAATVSGLQNHVYYTRYFINNDASNEHTTRGNAVSKAVTSKVPLANGMFAEDLLVYINAYRPPGTNLFCYAKFFNSADSDAFVDKNWTRLEVTDNANVYSSLLNYQDLYRYTYGVRLYPPSLYTFGSTVTTVTNQTNVTASGGVFQTGNVAVGSVVKIYQALFPNTDYMIASVTNVISNTVITIDQPVANLGVIGTGLSIDLINHGADAFRNILNQNVVRYYATGGNYLDTYNTWAVKVVFQSNNMAIIPYLSSLTSIAVSA
jgi:hypothetical protein